MDSYHKVSLKGKIVRVGLILISALLVTYLLPREKRFGFDFKLNKPWTHQQVIAMPLCRRNATVWKGFSNLITTKMCRWGKRR